MLLTELEIHVYISLIQIIEFQSLNSFLDRVLEALFHEEELI